MKKITLIFYVILFLFSCKHELERPTWDNTMIVPLVQTKMNINNMLTDTNLNISENTEGFINLIYEESFIDMDLDTIVKIDAIADEQTHTLDSTSFKDVIISDTATIGETIQEIPLLAFLLPNGSTNSIPAVPNIASNDTINVDASEYFETMTLYKGMLIISLSNGYPTDIANVDITLLNATNQNIIANFSFPFIASGDIVIDSISIAGQTIDENILGILNNMDINASNGPVLIDYSDAIITTVTISDIGVTEATAIFPEQQLTETLKEHSFDLGQAQIEEIGIKEGTVKINVLSTLPNGKMVYNIPSLSKNGIPFTSGDMIIPQATSNELTTFTFDFEGYILDLKGQEGRLGGDTVNTIYTESYTFIDSTGTLETINQTDSFYSFVEFDLKTKYAKGYIGQDTLEFGPEITETNLFNMVESGSINLESANISIGINNYIGADIGVQINYLSALNNNTEIMAAIDNTKIHNIERAILSANNIITPTYTEINIDAEEMLEILPDKINTTANFYINRYGQTTTHDFLFTEYPINATMNLKVPLSIMTDNLTFIDTTAIDIPNENEFEIEKVYLTIENDFPFDAEIKLILLDENDLFMDTLINKTMISAAEIDNNNIVVNSTSSTIEIDYNEFDNIAKVVSISAFTTQPINQFVDIYSNYEMDITLSAKILKTIGE